jgi:hypothetical protein
MAPQTPQRPRSKQPQLAIRRGTQIIREPATRGATLSPLLISSANTPTQAPHDLQPPLVTVGFAALYKAVLLQGMREISARRLTPIPDMVAAAAP